MNKYKYPKLAKPSGITLDQHQNDVISEGNNIARHYPFAFSKYQKITGKSLERRLELITRFHDDGKKHEVWQNACQMDYDNYLTWKGKYGGSFQDYANNKKEEAGKYLRKAGLRHEFQSLVFNERKKLPICLQAAIAAHHSKLGFKHEDRWKKEGVEKFWKIFQRESNRVIDDKLDLAQVVKLHYEFAGPRGLLQLADHRASALEDQENVPNYKPFTYRFPHSEKRNVQKLIELYWDDELLLIRAATGAGKTDAALLWASKQIENFRADRLIVAMPTRFTSNALAINVSESLSDTGLYHSSAWFHKFQDDIDAGKVKRKEASKTHEFARLLQTPITVCTIDHLLIALTLTREDHHLITFNLSNSCLVIDEADFYDDFTLANIFVLLEVLRYWKVPVLLMSASLPESILPCFQQIGYNVNSIREDNTDINEYTRPRFKIHSISKYSSISEIEPKLKLCIERGNAIVFANTVDRAIQYLDWFVKNTSLEVCLYHSRFTEPDKKLKEEKLINMLGRNAWAEDSASGIAILTQIGEMSINISADIMVSELCPIDRLTQRAGRLCRFDKSKIGEFHIVIPEKEASLYPAPYGEFDLKTKTWIPSNALLETLEEIKCELYSAKKLVELLNKIYNERNEFSAKASENAKNLKEYFKFNWLINSKQVSAKDDTGVNFWKSRDISPQETVFIEKPKTYFKNYLDFQAWKVNNSVELPVYLIQKGKKNHMVEVYDVYIKDEVESIIVIREGFYNFKSGISFKEEEQIW